MNIEDKILNSLLYDEKYARKVIPFLELDYFTTPYEQTAVSLILDFYDKYNKPPTPDILSIELEKLTNLPTEHYNTTKAIIDGISPSVEEYDWMIATTEKFCKDKALYNAVLGSIKVIDGRDKDTPTSAIPSILQNALSVTFDTHVGHDFLENAADRWELFNKKEARLPFDIDILNEITGGGLIKKTLVILMAATGGCKSLSMCSMAASNISMGKNVLYITLEMSEEMIAQRIDANLLNIDINDIGNLDKKTYMSRIGRLAEKTTGKLVIKEYPTSSANANHFRALLDDLKIKKNFTPDVIYIDYINICSSARHRAGSNANSYTIIKSIAEELRALAVEYDVPIVSATQVNRQGFNNSDVELTETSESIGLPATADLFLAIIGTEELESRGQLLWKQLKNRYSDPNIHKRFIVGVDKSKMRLYNVEAEAQHDIVGSSVPNPAAVGNKSFTKGKAAPSGFNFE